MKKIIISSVFVALIMLMSSCGSSSIQGTWKVDPSSLDLVLGEGFPEQMKLGVEEMKKEATSERTKSEADKVTLELLEGGVAKLKYADADERTQEFKWSQNGNVLNLNGEVDGEKFNANLDIMESSANEVMIGITGESLLEQIKAEQPELLENQMMKMLDLDKIVTGSKVSVKMKKA